MTLYDMSLNDTCQPWVQLLSIGLLSPQFFQAETVPILETSAVKTDKNTQEVLLVLYPYFQVVFFSMFTISHLFLAESPKMYLNSVPREYREIGTIKVIITALEIFTFAIIAAVYYFKVFVELLFIHNVLSQLHTSEMALKYVGQHEI